MPAPEERRRLGAGKGEAGAGSGGGRRREVPPRACRRDKDKVENRPCVASVFIGFPIHFLFFLSSFFWYFPLPTFLFFYISIFILFSV